MTSELGGAREPEVGGAAGPRDEVVEAYDVPRTLLPPTEEDVVVYEAGAKDPRAEGADEPGMAIACERGRF